MYFKDFPVILYDSKEVTNLLRRVAIRSKVKTNVMFFDTYDVKEGETPEMIADKSFMPQPPGDVWFEEFS